MDSLVSFMKNYTDFDTCAPEEVGITSASVLNLIDRAQKCGLHLHSFMLLRHGKAAAQCWWKPYSPEIPHHLYSFSKSITATAVGFALAEKKLKLDDRVISFFPRRIGDTADPRIYSMTVEHLLCMTSGAVLFNEATMHLHTDWVEWFLNAPLFSFPGDKFVYNSMNSYMLSAILRKVTGVGLVDYLMPRLFEPLGIERPDWYKCPLGVECGGWGLLLKTEDMAKFAQLYLDGGKWKGKQILPEGWSENASALHTRTDTDSKFTSNPHSRSGYGYHFWLNDGGDSYRADGMMAQYGIILPKKDTVIITTAGTADQMKVLDLIWDTVIPYIDAIPEGSMPGADYDELCRVSNHLALPSPAAIIRSRGIEDRFSGKRFGFSENVSSFVPLAIRYLYEMPPLGIDWVQFDFGDDISTMKWHEDGHCCRVDFRLDGEYCSGELPLGQRTVPVVTKGAWTAADTLEVDIRFIRTPHMLRAIFRFSENTLSYSFDETPTVEDSIKTVLNFISGIRPVSSHLAKAANRILTPIIGKPCENDGAMPAALTAAEEKR